MHSELLYNMNIIGCCIYKVEMLVITFEFLFVFLHKGEWQELCVASKHYREKR